MTDDFYQIRVEQEKLHKAFSQLNSLYATIPSTKGCLENNCKEGGCKSWCCEFQVPQLLYVEFLYVLHDILKNWPIDKIVEIVDKSVYLYVTNYPTKGCIFFNTKTNLCECHKTRSLNCRIYGITPYEEFHPRYLKTLETNKNIFGSVVKDQCDLVKTESGKEVTTKDTNKWWNKLVNIECSIGIKKEIINDEVGGTYRTPHDHIIYYFLSEKVLYNLQNLRLSTTATDEEKRAGAMEYLIQFHNKLNKLQG